MVSLVDPIPGAPRSALIPSDRPGLACGWTKPWVRTPYVRRDDNYLSPEEGLAALTPQEAQGDRCAGWHYCPAMRNTSETEWR
jgi:hypothetical protein